MTGDDSTSSDQGIDRWGLAGLILLVVSGLFFVFGAVNYLLADAGNRLPADHNGTFSALTGTSFGHIRATSPSSNEAMPSTS